MQPLKLFPSQNRLFLGTGFGVFLVILGLGPALGIGGTFPPGLALFFLGAAGWLLYQCVPYLITPRPVFQADADGFRVKDSGMHPWSDLIGVIPYDINVLRGVPVRGLKFRLEGGMLGKSETLHPLLMPGSPEAAIHQILTYKTRATTHGYQAHQVPQAGPVAIDPASPWIDTAAPAARARKQPGRPDHPQPARPATRTLRPARSFHPTVGDFEGPIKTKKSLRERVFGRREVI